MIIFAQLIFCDMSEAKKPIIPVDDEPLDVGLHHFKEEILTPGVPGEEKNVIVPKNAEDNKPMPVRKERKKGIVMSGNMATVSGGPKRLSVYLDKKTYSFIVHLRSAKGVSIPSILRESVLDILKKYKDEYDKYMSVYEEEQ